jgi:hypothetical protein
MAVTSVKLSWRDRRNRISADGIEAQLVYTALTDNPADGAEVVREDSRVPHLGQLHPRDARLGCIDVDPECVGPQYWEITCQYKNNEDASEDPDDLLKQAPDIEWSTEETQEAVDEDADGTPILNPNGEPYDPPLTKPFQDEVLRVTRYEGSSRASA